MSYLDVFLWKCEEGSFFASVNSRHFNLKLKTLWLHHCQHFQDMGGYVFHFSFICILFSSFWHSHALSSFFLLLPYCFSSSLSSLFCFSLSLPPFPSLASGRFCLLPQASCVFISVIYFYKCQTAFLPSIQRKKKDEKKGGKNGEWQQKSGVVKKSKMRQRKKKKDKVWNKFGGMNAFTLVSPLYP